MSHTPRYYCKCCNIWMDDNVPSRQIHDRGKRHKEKSAESMQAKRDDRAAQARQQEQLTDQLQEIRRKAEAAVGSGHGLSSAGQAYHPGGSAPSLAWRGPAAHMPTSTAAGTAAGTAAAAAVATSRPSGQAHSTRGQRYLSGQQCLALLQPGTACQLQLQLQQQGEWGWVPAVISARHTHTQGGDTSAQPPPPQTTSQGQAEEQGDLRLDVTYFIVGAPPSTGAGADVRFEEAVPPSRLRIEIEIEGEGEGEGEGDGDPPLAATASGDGNDDTPAPAPAPAPVPDAATGLYLGGWQTVSTRLLDDEQEAAEQRVRSLQEERERKIHTHTQSSGVAAGAGAGAGADTGGEAPEGAESGADRDRDRGRGKGRPSGGVGAFLRDSLGLATLDPRLDPRFSAAASTAAAAAAASGGGSYRGISAQDLHTTADDRESELAAVAGGAKVAFKKRRVGVAAPSSVGGSCPAPPAPASASAPAPTLVAAASLTSQASVAAAAASTTASSVPVPVLTSVSSAALPAKVSLSLGRPPGKRKLGQGRGRFGDDSDDDA